MKNINEDSFNFTLYPNLLLLLWDKKRKVLEAAEAFDVIDERLAKYIRPESLTDEEKNVIQILADRFSAGIINAWEQ